MIARHVLLMSCTAYVFQLIEPIKGLAALKSGYPGIALMQDEPTNALDLPSILWLQVRAASESHAP